MVTVISCSALDGYCYFLVCSAWLLIFPVVLWMVILISWCALDGYCNFLVCSGWLLLFPGVLWMVTVISWCALDGHCYFLVCSGWLLLVPGVLCMITVIPGVPWMVMTILLFPVVSLALGGHATNRADTIAGYVRSRARTSLTAKAAQCL